MNKILVTLISHVQTVSPGSPPITPDDPLGAVIDSIAMLDFLLFVEREFSIQIKDTDVVPANFGTLSRVAYFIESKLGKAG